MNPGSDTRPPPVRRGFVDGGGGQVHYRTAGPAAAGNGGRAAAPLVVLHASPGSSRQLVGLIGALAAGRRLIAPDTPGNGDSDPVSQEEPTIADLARGPLAAIEALTEGPVDLYGSHTGASIAMEIAIARPERVRRLILDGMGLYGAAERDELLARYALPFTPDGEGTQLTRAWHFCRDQHLFWPWYRREAEARLAGGLPSPEDLHAFVVEVLKAATTYHRSYRAAFRHPKRERLPRITVPTLVCCAPGDMLWPSFEDVVARVPGARRGILPQGGAVGAPQATVAILARFLDGE